MSVKEHFRTRTNNHISLVYKYLKKIADLKLPEIDNDVLLQKGHDMSKFEEPEYTPYLHITWKYKMQGEGKTYNPPKEIEEAMRSATFFHVVHNPHHPEYWDNNATIESINLVNRDAKPEQRVDGTKMPLSNVAQMIADWCAVAEEKNTKTKDWADKNVNIRWTFNPDQVTFIYKLIDKLS